ncbi:S1 family peptidase [Bradyrhizobium canariense]|uniref:Trypsin-like peptidase domain-containing protein n=1 Tax=Bradyrhizobium canariense TaxID=255045 RepID=A0A1H1TD27_9BRAD|nr:serine protease [Bradyrhizobium canariense]SDS58068.1 Trypsin-like peptidase domain-containing protein [Bradyrhizobium canariense]
MIDEKRIFSGGLVVIPDGWQWNEAEIESNDQLNEGVLTLMVIGNDVVPVLIGTAFFVSADGYKGTAISAAHCFEHIKNVLYPNKPHHPTTPLEFLPPPTEVDLRQVKAVYIKDAQVHVCSIEIAVWDSETDLAVLTVLAPTDQPELFRAFFWIDDKIPSAGEQVAMIGVGEMKVHGDIEDPRKGRMERRLVVRIGYVEEVFEEATYLLKSPSVQTSIAIYSGMSGGLVARFAPPDNIKPFALISHAPEPQPVMDRSISGHSMGSILKAKLTFIEKDRQLVEIEINNIGVGKTDPVNEVE